MSDFFLGEPELLAMALSKTDAGEQVEAPAD
jgi:hypothetical protein